MRPSHPNKPLCLSVHRSVRPSVRLSVRRSVRRSVRHTLLFFAKWLIELRVRDLWRSALFFDKSRDGVKRLPMSGLKWWKMVKYSIFGHLSPFVPAYGQPLCPIFAFIDKNVVTSCWSNDIWKKKITPGYFHPVFPMFAWKFNFWPFLAIFH